MKTIDKEMSLFGDLYYNATRAEIADYAKNMKKYPMTAITSYLKLIMQDVLAHLAGSTSFMDACMVRDKIHFESKINNKIGKRKLVEFLSLLEEFDKLGIHMDEVEFAKNDNDKFLEDVIKERRNGILQDYLTINNLNDFFELVMMVVTIMPMAKRIEEFDAFIPDPMDFDFKRTYYESIDYLLYYMDKDKHNSLMNKHEKMGREINLIEWIRNYKNRYAIKDILREEVGIKTDGFDKDSVSDNDLNEDFEEKIMDFARKEYDFSEFELEYLRSVVRDIGKEIFILKSQVVEMRKSAKAVLETQNIKLTDEQLEALEDEFVMETVVKHVTKKPRKNRPVTILIYAAIIASLVLIPTMFSNVSTLGNGYNKVPTNKFGAVENEKNDDVRMEDDNQDSHEDEKVADESTMISIVLPDDIPEVEEPLKEDEQMESQDEDDVYKTEFILGEKVTGNVPFYISSTSDEVLGFLNEEVIIIGYFATVDSKDGMSVLYSCRTQEKMDKFLRLYNGDGSDIVWRAAVTRVNNEKVQEYLTKGEEIPYELTTCYIDCAPVREMEKIRGK